MSDFPGISRNEKLRSSVSQLWTFSFILEYFILLF
jgi:hypothetical protein